MEYQHFLFFFFFLSIKTNFLPIRMHEVVCVQYDFDSIRTSHSTSVSFYSYRVNIAQEWVSDAQLPVWTQQRAVMFRSTEMFFCMQPLD